METFFYKVAGFLNFRVSKYFFQLNLVFAEDSRCSCIGFCPGLRSSHCSCSVKKYFLEILQISQENTCIEVSF